jgi:hypothetical protein
MRRSVIFGLKVGGAWTEPALYLREPYGLYDFMSTASGVCYVGSNGRQGKLRDFSSYDICALRMAAGDTAIESLGPPINTPGFDGDFYVARDESKGLSCVLGAVGPVVGKVEKGIFRPLRSVSGSVGVGAGVEGCPKFAKCEL